MVSPRKVYDNLQLLEKVDTTRSALFRRQAQEVLADPNVSLSWRQAIADRLNHANHLLALHTVGGDDSY